MLSLECRFLNCAYSHGPGCSILACFGEMGVPVIRPCIRYLRRWDEIGRSECFKVTLLIGSKQNPTAPPLQFPRATPQHPSQPPEISPQVKGSSASAIRYWTTSDIDTLLFGRLIRKHSSYPCTIKACAWSLNIPFSSCTQCCSCIFPWLSCVNDP